MLGGTGWNPDVQAGLLRVLHRLLMDGRRLALSIYAKVLSSLNLFAGCRSPNRQDDCRDLAVVFETELPKIAFLNSAEASSLESVCPQPDNFYPVDVRCAASGV